MATDMRIPYLVAGLVVVVLGGAVAGRLMLAGGSSNHSQPISQERYEEELATKLAGEIVEAAGDLARTRMEQAEATQVDDRFRPWPTAPEVNQWQGHYLVLQGENYLPVRRAFATPFVTLFQLEPTYMPHSPFSPLDDSDNCSGDGGGSDNERAEVDQAISEVVPDMAVVTAESGVAAAGERVLNCPNRLGVVWSAGSYIVDEAGENIAGQDFSEGVSIFQGRDVFADPTDDGFLVVAEGGPGRSADPVIKPLLWSSVIIVDYPIHGNDEESNLSLVPPAPDLPQSVWDRNPSGVVIGDGPVWPPIDELLDALEDAIQASVGEAGADPEFILVHRGDPSLAEQKVAERLRRIRERTTQFGKVRTVSFGQEAPICSDSTEKCWSMNRSLILYMAQ